MSNAPQNIHVWIKTSDTIKQSVKFFFISVYKLFLRFYILFQQAWMRIINKKNLTSILALTLLPLASGLLKIDSSRYDSPRPSFLIVQSNSFLMDLWMVIFDIYYQLAMALKFQALVSLSNERMVSTLSFFNFIFIRAPPFCSFLHEWISAYIFNSCVT